MKYQFNDLDNKFIYHRGHIENVSVTTVIHSPDYDHYTDWDISWLRSHRIIFPVKLTDDNLYNYDR